MSAQSKLLRTAVLGAAAAASALLLRLSKFVDDKLKEASSKGAK